MAKSVYVIPETSGLRADPQLASADIRKIGSSGNRRKGEMQKNHSNRNLVNSHGYYPRHDVWSMSFFAIKINSSEGWYRYNDGTDVPLKVDFMRICDREPGTMSHD